MRTLRANEDDAYAHVTKAMHAYDLAKLSYLSAVPVAKRVCSAPLASALPVPKPNKMDAGSFSDEERCTFFFRKQLSEQAYVRLKTALRCRLCG